MNRSPAESNANPAGAFNNPAAAGPPSPPNPEDVDPTTAPVLPAPLPVRNTDWGLPVALSVKDTLAVRGPNPVGVNVADTVHVALGFKLAPVHVSAVFAKSAVFAPVTATAETDSVTAPVFVNVVVCAAVVDPTDVCANPNDAGENFTGGATIRNTWLSYGPPAL